MKITTEVVLVWTGAGFLVVLGGLLLADRLLLRPYGARLVYRAVMRTIRDDLIDDLACGRVDREEPWVRWLLSQLRTQGVQPGRPLGHGPRLAGTEASCERARGYLEQLTDARAVYLADVRSNVFSVREVPTSRGRRATGAGPEQPVSPFDTLLLVPTAVAAAPGHATAPGSRTGSGTLVVDVTEGVVSRPELSGNAVPVEQVEFADPAVVDGPPTRELPRRAAPAETQRALTTGPRREGSRPVGLAATATGA
jgi:hypothetical protein